MRPSAPLRAATAAAKFAGVPTPDRARRGPPRPRARLTPAAARSWSGRGAVRRWALLAFAAACRDPAGPPPTPDDAYELVFDGEVGAGRRLLFRAAGRGAPVPYGRGVAASRPATRPAGRRLLVQWAPDDRLPATLAVLGEATVNPVPLGSGTDEIEGEPSWSPDGRRVAFMSQAADPAGDILVGALYGTQLSEVRNLTPRDPANPHPQPDRTPAWSPDGTRIAFTTYRAGGAAIWTMAADGSDARPVTAAGAHGDYEPSWSPDGRWITFQRVSAEAVRVGIVAAAGGAPRFLPWPGKAYNPAWSPDGRRIAFSSDLDGDMDIYVVAPDGAGLARVRRPGADRNPAWLRR